MEKSMKVTLEQQKIISHPLRSQIIILLFDKAMTAKQVATQLGKTAGNTHYHIQKLYQHGIIELVHENSTKSIIEKYYRSKAINFTSQDPTEQNNDIHSQFSSILTLSPEELKQFENRLSAIIVEFARLSVSSHKNRLPYQFNSTISKPLQEDEK